MATAKEAVPGATGLVQNSLPLTEHDGRVRFGTPDFVLHTIKLAEHRYGPYIRALQPDPAAIFSQFATNSCEDIDLHVNFRRQLMKLTDASASSSLRKAFAMPDWLSIEACLLHDPDAYRQEDFVDWDNTPLCIAIESKNFRIVNALLNTGKVHAGARSSAALCKACVLGDIDLVRKLVDCGAQINESDGGKGLALPLSGATFSGNKALVEWLLEAGADIHANREEALFMALVGVASNTCTMEMVEFVLTKGAKIGDNQSATRLLAYATEGSNTILLEKFLNHPAIKAGLQPCHINLALIMAVHHSNHAAMSYLLDQHNADINYLHTFEAPETGNDTPACATPLTAAFDMIDERNGYFKDMEKIMFLLDRGADPNAHDHLVLRELVEKPAAVLRRADGTHYRQVVYDVWFRLDNVRYCLQTGIRPSDDDGANGVQDDDDDDESNNEDEEDDDEEEEEEEGEDPKSEAEASEPRSQICKQLFERGVLDPRAGNGRFQKLAATMDPYLGKVFLDAAKRRTPKNA
ncbi:hypothetical protein PhCBS80983_g03266 [Powellomyces hirtus]|uniref:Uncharacterized protein n=1 Tax=Powellomyces hirtus TaxID=109895 RepID=A0A507E2B9_9FUNG|nr:hypothetical protein PhCBS80983_g03266 [Powellomyces hirtus]